MNNYDLIEEVPVTGNDEDAVMRNLARIIVDQIWWVIGIAACIIFGAVIYAKYTTRVYSADALIQVESSSGTSGSGSQALAALTPSGGMHTEAEIQIIKSRAVVEPVVEQFKLNFGAWPKTMPYLSKVTSLLAHRGHPLGALFGMSSYAWGGEEIAVDSIQVPKDLEGTQLTLKALGNGHYQVADPYGAVLVKGVVGEQASANGVNILVTKLIARPQTEFYVMRFNQLDAVSGLAGGLQVSELGADTGIVQLSFMGSDPHAITNIINAVAASYLRQRQERAQEEASRMLSFLNSEMPRLRDEVQRAETALSEYQSRSGAYQPSAEAGVYLSGGIEYEKQIAAMRVVRAQLLTRFTEDSPELKTIDAQLAAMSQQKESFEEHFKTLPGSERQALSLQRDAKVSEEIYVALLNKIQELSISRAGTIGNVHIIDEALPPSSPVKPKAPLIISASVFLGLMAGVAFAFCRQRFFTGLTDPDFVERRFQLPIFGSIPYSAEQARSDRLAASARAAALPHPPESATRFSAIAALPAGIGRLMRPRPAEPAPVPTGTQTIMPPTHPQIRPLLVKTHPFDVSVEGLRGLRATLQFGFANAPNRIIAFTSPAPSDGKSFLCANLAALLAETGKRVLLIDADLRRGRLAQYLGRSPNGGLTELLTGQVDLDVAARTTGVEGLHFIAAGAYPPNPSEILASTRFSEVLSCFEQQFDIVIVDTPPLLAAADAAIIANFAGSTVLVMHAGAHTERNISESLKKLRRARARVIGGVMNAVPLKSGGRYGTYDYAYSYTYTAADSVGDTSQR
jgi:tyrosine-protein kinase Etk/Wzc